MRLLPVILAVVGCAEAPTAILVRIEVDETVREDVDQLSLEVESGGESVFMLAREFSGGAETISLRPGALADDAALGLAASALLSDGSSIATRATARFVPGEDQDVCLFVDGRCEGLDCGGDDCRAGGCEPVEKAVSACVVPRCDEAATCDDREAVTIDECDADGACIHEASPDVDGDGHLARWADGDDCDDEDPDTHPGAADPCDGQDQGCDDVLDGKILAQVETSGYAVMARVLVPGTTAIVAWMVLGDSGESTIVVARRSEDGLDVVREYGEAAWPALAPYEDGAVLAYFDLRSITYRLIGLDADGNPGDPYDLDFGGMPYCDTAFKVERPAIASNGSLVAVGYHDCEPTAPDSPQPRLAVLDLDEDAVLAEHTLDDSPGFTMYPSVANMDRGFAVAWARGAMAGVLIPDGATIGPSLLFAVRGTSPALLRAPAGLGVVFIDPLTLELAGWDFRTLKGPAPMVIEPDAARQQFLIVFAGSQSSAGAAALAYATASEPGDYRFFRPALVRIVESEPRRVEVDPLLAENLGSGLGDVTFGPDGSLFYVDTIGTVGTQESTVVLARMSCDAG